MKALKVTGMVLGMTGRLVLAGLLIIGTFAMNCIGLLVGAICNN